MHCFFSTAFCVLRTTRRFTCSAPTAVPEVDEAQFLIPTEAPTAPTEAPTFRVVEGTRRPDKSVPALELVPQTPSTPHTVPAAGSEKMTGPAVTSPPLPLTVLPTHARVSAAVMPSSVKSSNTVAPRPVDTTRAPRLRISVRSEAIGATNTDVDLADAPDQKDSDVALTPAEEEPSSASLEQSVDSSSKFSLLELCPCPVLMCTL